MDTTIFIAILTALLGGGGIGAVVAYKKAGPEVESISVKTMREVIEELRLELGRLQGENKKLRETVRKLEITALKAEKLQKRIDELEKTVKSLSNVGANGA
jgi:predicted transcriptional regulator